MGSMILARATRNGRLLVVLAALALAGCDSVEERVARHHERGVALMAEGESAKAFLEFRNALKLNENYAPSRFRLARLYENDGEIGAAVANYRLTAELDPGNVEALVRLAQLLMLGGAAEEAAGHAEAAVAQAPEDPDALSALATIRLREGDRDAALALADKVLAARPDHVGANLVRIGDLARSNAMPEALAALDRLLADAPTEKTLNLVKLQLLEQMGDASAVAAHLKKLAQTYPEDSGQYQRALARIQVREGDMDGADATLRALVAAEPDNIDLALDLVRFTLQAKGAEAAGAELDGLIAASADPARTHRLRLARVDLDVASNRRDAAIETLRGMMAADATGPNALDVSVKLAGLLLAAGEKAEARTLVDGVLAQDARNADALAVRGAILIDEDRPTEAVRDLAVAVTEQPDSPRLLTLLARAHDREGNRDMAIDRMSAAARLSEFAPDASLAAAQYLSAAGRHEAAATMIEESLRRQPENPRLLAALAESRLRAGDWTRAEAAATALSKVAGGDEVAAQIRAASLRGQGRVDESNAVLEGLAENPDASNRALRTLITSYLRSGEIDRAEALVDERLAAAPKDPETLLLRAEIDLARDRPADAEGRLREIIAAQPTSFLGHLALARMKMALGDMAAAEAAAREGVAVAERPEPLRLALAQVLERRQDWPGAIAEYEAIYDQQKSSLLIVNNLASLLIEHRSDDPASVERAGRIALRLRDSTVPEFQDTYGWVRYLQGDYADALRSLLPAAEARPDNGTIRYHAGMALLKAGQTESARGHLVAALDLDATHVWAEAARMALESLPPAAP